MSRAGAFLRRDLAVALSYRLPFVLELASAGIFVVTLVYVGKLVPDQAVPGGYFAFATVGVALLALAQAGLSVVGSSLRQEQVQGTLEVLLSAGLSTTSLAVGMVAYPMIFAVARVVVYLAVAAALGALAGAGNWGLAATAVGLAMVAFAGLGLIAAALVLVLRQAAGAVAILVTLIGLGSGVGFPRGFLPSWAEALGQLSPLTHALEIARGALFEQRGWAEAAASLGTLLGLTVASVALGYTTLVLGLRWARRRTTLAGY